MTMLVSSAPATFSTLLGLLQTAGAAQSPAVPVFSFALNQYEPAAYVLLQGIANQRMVPSRSDYGHTESFSITGIATVFSGDATPDDPTATTDVMTATYDLYNNVVMGPVVDNRFTLAPGSPGLPWSVTPGKSQYDGSPGSIAGEQGGFCGVITFSVDFKAIIYPS